jgi:hypothetical protein
LSIYILANHRLAPKVGLLRTVELLIEDINFALMVIAERAITTKEVGDVVDTLRANVSWIQLTWEEWEITYAISSAIKDYFVCDQFNPVPESTYASGFSHDRVHPRSVLFYIPGMVLIDPYMLISELEATTKHSVSQSQTVKFAEDRSRTTMGLTPLLTSFPTHPEALFNMHT